MRTAVFTIISLNYGAFARTLMESISHVHPEWERHVLLVDRCDDLAGLGSDLFSTITIENLPLPKMHEFLFRYGIMELNTAVKPYMFSHLRSRGYERVIYFDPDILIIDRLADVERLLEQGAAAVITPHIAHPLEDGRLPGDLEILRAGAYNLGFLALNSLPASDAFIAWWERKLEHGAVSDPGRGLFTDQRWVDLAPGMFGDFAILRDPGYNVAYWNLPHRQISRCNDVWFAGGRPLRFFHFSGFDPLNPEPLSKHQNRLTLSTIGQARELALEYAERVLGHRFAEFRSRPYAFGYFTDGTPIPSSIRALYREDPDVRLRAGEYPFESAEYFALGQVGGLPIILRALWLERGDLQRAFPDPLGASRLAYYNWFAEAGGIEAGISERFILPIRRALMISATLGGSIPNDMAPPLAGSEALNMTAVFGEEVNDINGPVPASIWARCLVVLHKRMTGGKLSIARQIEYRRVNSLIGFLRLAFAQFRRSRRGGKIGFDRQKDEVFADQSQKILDVRHTALTEASSTRVTGSVSAWPSRISVAPTKSSRTRSRRFSGFYPEPGKQAWWIGSHARFSVTASIRVGFQGIHHADPHERSHGKRELNIGIGFNDQPSRVVTVQSGRFDAAIDIEPPDNWPATLYIVPEATFVPKELGLSGDARRLSVQISTLSVAGVPMFDAARQAEIAASSALVLPGVNVIGYARSEHGIGQSLRQFITALDAIEIPNVVIDFNINNSSRGQDYGLETRIVDQPIHSINVFHINADQMPEAEMHLPSHFFSRYNIGFWHWELPELSDEHLNGFDNLDEIWVPSGFVQDAVAKRSSIPVVRMPHAIHFTVSPAACRARFGLPDDRFLFLMIYDFSSYQDRKNPQAVLDAFDLAFRGKSRTAMLVIKTQNAHFHELDEADLRESLAGRNDVFWINRTLTRQEVYDLESACDALVSLHRSEGYGLGLAEAMFLGKPVIATNWSGNTEFMRPQNSLPVNYTLVKIEKDVGVYRAGQTWADPDIAHAASLMRQIAEEEGLRERISAEARHTMLTEFSPKAIGQKIRTRLAYIQTSLIGGPF